MPTAHQVPDRRRDARFQVNADWVSDWLATAVDSMGHTLADLCGLADHDTFRRGGQDMHDRIQVLVDRAHSDGIVTVPDHRLTLWQVGDEGFLLTIDPPSPPRLCSLHLSVDDLVPDKTTGSVAAVAVLMAVGQVANQLLDEQRRALAAASSAPTAFPDVRQRRLAGPARATPPGANPADAAGPHQPHRGR